MNQFICGICGKLVDTVVEDMEFIDDFPDPIKLLVCPECMKKQKPKKRR